MHGGRRTGLKILLGALAASAVAACSVAGILAGAASATTARLRVGSTTPLPYGALVTGRMVASSPVRVTVALEPQDPSALGALATAVSTPGSSQYGRFLTVPQFARRFGATPAHVAAVQAALRDEGLSVGSVGPNHLTIPVTGSAIQVERAFSVSLERVRAPSGRIAYANEQAPTLPANIAGYVQGVVGLDSVTPPQPAGLSKPELGERLSSMARSPRVSPRLSPRVATGGPQPCSAASLLAQAQASASGLTADQVATAYQFGNLYGGGDFGQGQTVAVLEIDPTQASDVSSYQGCYGTGAAVNFVNVDGGPGAYTQGSSDDGEPSLDIEQIIGLAPKASVLVYQGSPNDASVLVDLLSAAVSQDQAKVISSSLGVCEALAGASAMSSENTLLQEAATQGQSFFDSSGDSGSNMCFQNTSGQNTSLSVIDPGAQPFATGVGGTTLYTTSPAGCSAGCYYVPGVSPVEGVWNDGYDGSRASGTGGGISSQWKMPSYQSGAPASLGVLNANSSAAPCAGGSTDCRELPDVSANADPDTGYVVFSNGGWTVTGGTSAAAPLWGAFTALVNADSACRGLTVGFANPALYQLGGSSYASDFNDVKSASPFTHEANNDALYQYSIGGNPSDLFPVTSGYDMATGLGSPIVPALASSLCGLRAPVYAVAVTSPGAQHGVVGHAIALQVHGSDSGPGVTLSYSTTGLPAGLSISPAGLISGTPTTAGSSVVTVSASDAFANHASAQFLWTVIKPGPPTVSHKSLRGLSSRKPKLSFKIAAGRNAAALKELVISLPRGLSFSRSSKSLGKGIGVSSGGRKARFKPSVSRGKLVITLRSPVTSATVTVGPPAITVTSATASKVRRKKLKRLKVGVEVVDAALTVTQLPLTMNV